MRAALFSLAMLLSPSLATAECVALLHGLARGPDSMLVMENALTSAGYKVVNVGYPSRVETLESLIDTVPERGLSGCNPLHTHFVTHSMGGLLVRGYTARHPEMPVGRVVMLGPPNQGSAIVDQLRDTPGFELFNGPAGVSLATDGLPPKLGPAQAEIGVIAGDRSLNPIFSWLIDGDDDGKVSVAATHLPGQSDHITLPVTHTFMMNDPMVIAQTILFLQTGSFDHNASYDDLWPF
ncbi:MAG: esterase/lipase family protein [Pikeienuella sp.]